MVRNWGRHDGASMAGAAVRLFRLNELACVTLMGLGYLAMNGYILAAVGFVWYAALYVLRG
jgi:hypothetical protein